MKSYMFTLVKEISTSAKKCCKFKPLTSLNLIYRKM